jgi:hypothetical protein
LQQAICNGAGTVLGLIEQAMSNLQLAAERESYLAYMIILSQAGIPQNRIELVQRIIMVGSALTSQIKHIPEQMKDDT